MVGGMQVLLVLLLIGYSQEQGSDEVDCVSREEFDRVNAKLLGTKDELDVWQKTTIDILKKYLLDNQELPGGSSCNATAELAGSLSQLQTDVQDIQHQISTINNNSLLHDQRQQQLLEGVAQNATLTHLSTEIQEILDNSALQYTDLEDQLGEISRELSEIKANQLALESGTFHNPAPSCHLTNLPAGSQSGYYYIQSSSAGNGTSLQYCDITRRCCGSTGGWMRVANLDMTDPTQNCPSGFRLITSPKRSCGRPGSGCVSTTFPAHGVQYSRVCGRVIAYQDKTTDGFQPYYNNRQVTIDGVYVDGVSLTHGQNPRKHIWTFVAANDETRSNQYVCPCTKTDTAYTGVVPPFIGQDYFCDTASRNGWQVIFYPDNPLWDGAGCGGTSSCCSFNNPPWFCKQLPQPTTDDIELRLCGDYDRTNEDTPIETIELYVQ